MNPLVIPIIGDLIKGGFEIIDKMIPDKDAAAKAKQELLLKQLEAEREYLRVAAEESKGQVEINKIDAAGNAFQSGWRPSLGYVCVLGFAYNFLVYPTLQWFVAWKGLTFTPPPPLSDMLFELTLGMLGLGMMRTYEKVRIGSSKNLVPGANA
jgi:hypothetical protein